MDKRLILHLATAGLTALMVGILVLFWSYPQLILYLLLIAFAALCYRVIYTVLAARLDLTQLEARGAPLATESETEIHDTARHEGEMHDKVTAVGEIDRETSAARPSEPRSEGQAPTLTSHPGQKKRSRRPPKNVPRDVEGEAAGAGELAEP